MEASLKTEAARNSAQPVARRVFLWSLGLVGPVAATAPNGLAVLFIVMGLAVIAGDPSARRLSGIPKVVALPMVGLLAWGYVTMLWAPDPALAAFTLTRLVLAVYAGLAIVSHALALDSAEIEQAERFFLAGYAAGLAILCAEIASQMVFGNGSSLFVQFIGPRAAIESFLNRSKTILSILLPLAISVGWRRHGPAAAAAIAAACLAVFVVGESLASAMGLVVAAGGAVAAVGLGSRLGVRLSAIGIVAMFMAAPFVARLPVLAELAQRHDITVSVYHRAAIWGFVAERIAERPFIGWGMEASRNIPNAHNTLREFTELLPLHPHNAPLQYWLELGAVGAILAAAIAAALALRTGGSLARRVAVMPTFLTAVFVACISYGLWQGWWYSSLWIIGTLATIVGRGAERSTGTPG
ncbi:MAG: O-antigen ligase family protein [Rhodospirillales bacterium]|nr:O-antigen ligase family protein [Rhodospirillales bacterium]